MKTSSRPKPVSKVTSTSRVNRGSPHRNTAMPPVRQNFQRRAMKKFWSSNAASKSGIIDAI
jgi:hypothetical protein